MELAAHTVLDAAYARGVRDFDAARGDGKAEAFLATWLARRGFGPGEVTVGSKWGYTYTGGWRVEVPVHEVKDLSVATLRRQFAESRELLGPNLRLYQIHSATLDSGVLDDPAVLEDLARLQASGVSIGVTVTGPKQAETIERALEVGGFDAVPATWNLLERAARSALAEAHAAGVGVIVKWRSRTADRPHAVRFPSLPTSPEAPAPRPTRSRSRQRWHSHGRMSFSAVPPPWRRSRATSPRLNWSCSSG